MCARFQKILFFFCVTACAQAAPATQAFESPEHGLTVSLPADWSIKEGLAGTIVSAVEPAPASAFRASVVITTEPLPPFMLFAAYLESHQEQLRETLPQFRQVAARAPPPGASSHELAYTFAAGGTACRVSVKLASAGRDIYILTASSAEADTARLAPLWKETLASFRVRPAKAPPRATKRVRDREKGFSIEFPRTWTLQENLKETTLIAFSPLEGPGDPFRENVNLLVEELQEATTLEEYLTANLKGLSDVIEGTVGVSAEDVRLGNTPAKRIRYRKTLESRSLESLAYLAVEGRRGYVVTAAGAAEEFARHEPEFLAICGSFRIE